MPVKTKFNGWRFYYKIYEKEKTPLIIFTSFNYIFLQFPSIIFTQQMEVLWINKIRRCFKTLGKERKVLKLILRGAR